MSYNKTFWQNNITIVDAEKLNKIEEGLLNLSVSNLNVKKDLEIIENKMDMKSNNGHTHLENATISDIDRLREEINFIENNLNEIKKNIETYARTFIDDVDIDNDNVLHLYSNGKLLKSIEHKETPIIKVSLSAPTDSTKIWIDTKY